MISQIKKCQECKLCFNQEPLLDKGRKCEVFWVGLSAKKVLCEAETPLSPTTNSGKIIQKIEESLENISTYKTNLVKCLPLNEKQKLRYPDKKEIDSCFANLQSEIKELSPKIVFLLGEKVYSSVGKHLNIKFNKWDEFNYDCKKHQDTYYIPVHHPSYIYVYKRKQTTQYISSIENLINMLI